MPLKHPFAWRKVKSPPLHFSSSAHQSYSHLFTLWDFDEGRFEQRIMLSRQRPPKDAYLIEIQAFPKGKNFSRRRVLNLLMIWTCHANTPAGLWRQGCWILLLNITICIFRLEKKFNFFMFYHQRSLPRVMAPAGVSNLTVCIVRAFMQQCLLLMIHYFKPSQLTLT